LLKRWLLWWRFILFTKLNAKLTSLWSNSKWAALKKPRVLVKCQNPEFFKKPRVLKFD
jgi:hypothetical protein